MGHQRRPRGEFNCARRRRGLGRGGAAGRRRRRRRRRRPPRRILPRVRLRDSPRLRAIRRDVRAAPREGRRAPRRSISPAGAREHVRPRPRHPDGPRDDALEEPAPRQGGPRVPPRVPRGHHRPSRRLPQLHRPAQDRQKVPKKVSESGARARDRGGNGRAYRGGDVERGDIGATQRHIGDQGDALGRGGCRGGCRGRHSCERR